MIPRWTFLQALDSWPPARLCPGLLVLARDGGMVPPPAPARRPRTILILGGTGLLGSLARRLPFSAPFARVPGEARSARCSPGAFRSYDTGLGDLEDAITAAQARRCGGGHLARYVS
jgi:hypothetical protein